MKKIPTYTANKIDLTTTHPVADIYVYICNYLYFMKFIKNSSAYTLRFYETDLRQAFEGVFPTTTASSPPPLQLTDSLPSTLKAKPINSVLEEKLLALAKLAQSNWAPLSPASRNRKAATLKSFFSWLHSEGHTARDLASLIFCPKVPTKLPHFLSVDEAIALLKSTARELKGVEKNKIPLFQHALICLLYGGGLRVSEACQIQFQAIDFNYGTCRVVGKGSKERLIILPPSALSVLRLIQSHYPNNKYVFGNTPLSTRKAYEWVRRAGTTAGLLRPLHPHALRHSYATHLLRSGANLRVLQELLGHASLQATSRYTHIGLDQLARTLEAHHPLSHTVQIAASRKKMKFS